MSSAKVEYRLFIILNLLLLSTILIFTNGHTASANPNESKRNIIITFNPGAKDPASQNPITARDVGSQKLVNPHQLIITPGTNITWLNKDYSIADIPAFQHSINTGDPDKGPDNMIYDKTLLYNKNFTFTFNDPGTFSWYDAIYHHIRGKITVTTPNTQGNTFASINAK